MARVRRPEKSCLVDPLKMSQPIGAAMAFCGVDKALPLLLGARGCASVGLVFLVRHFQAPIAIETLAVDELDLVLGRPEKFEQALLAVHERRAPALVGLLSTGLTEARGDDVRGMLRRVRAKYARSRPDFAALPMVAVHTPDFAGAYQDGWGAAVAAMVSELIRPDWPAGARRERQVNILAGQHLTPGDVLEIRDCLECFGLTPVVLPDVSGALGGLPAGSDSGGSVRATRLEDIRGMGASAFTIAVGEHMRPAAQSLHELAGVPYRVFDRLTGLGPSDEFAALLAELSGRAVPERFRRQRGQLLDAMLHAQACFGGMKAAVALDPDQLFSLCSWLADMGAEVSAAVSSAASPILGRIPAAEVLIGDLEDLERGAAGADLLIAPSSARQAAARLGLPLLRAGMPVADRLGAGHKVSVGYRGSRDLIYEAANLLLDRQGEPGEARALSLA